MRKQKKALPDLRSMIAGDHVPAADAEMPSTENQETRQQGNTETDEHNNQETTKPLNTSTAPQVNQYTHEPINQESGKPATIEARGQCALPAPSPKAEDRLPTRLPPVQVCVWLDPEVAGMIDTVRGALATRLPKRPTRSKLVEIVLRERLADVDALVDMLRDGSTEPKQATDES